MKPVSLSDMLSRPAGPLSTSVFDCFRCWNDRFADNRNRVCVIRITFLDKNVLGGIERNLIRNNYGVNPIWAPLNCLFT